MGMTRIFPDHLSLGVLLFFLLFTVFITEPIICIPIILPIEEIQEDAQAGFLGTWEYHGARVHFTFVLKSDGTGYLADEVDTFPFVYSMNIEKDPTHLDLTYQVDMAFGRISHTLIRLERTEEEDLLHWVSCHSETGPPEWPKTPTETPQGVTWITFHRVRHRPAS